MNYRYSIINSSQLPQCATGDKTTGILIRLAPVDRLLYLFLGTLSCGLKLLQSSLRSCFLHITEDVTQIALLLSSVRRKYKLSVGCTFFCQKKQQNLLSFPSLLPAEEGKNASAHAAAHRSPDSRGTATANCRMLKTVSNYRLCLTLMQVSAAYYFLSSVIHPTPENLQETTPVGIINLKQNKHECI